MAFQRKTKHYDETSLYEYAIGALGRRMRSVAEIKRLMRTRVAQQPDGNRLVEAVAERLKQERYLNDTNYAESYSSYRKENEKFGRLRVISDLKSRGVHPTVIDKAVDSAYSGVDEAQLARDFLRRKRVRPPAQPKDAARIFRMLLRAGFSSRSALRVLNGWKVDDEVLSALESEASEAPEHPEKQETE